MLKLLLVAVVLSSVVSISNGQTSGQNVCGTTTGLCGGGVCRNSGTWYECDCPGNFVGPSCVQEIVDSPCSTNPCNNGECMNTVSDTGTMTFRCNCPAGFTGQTCTTPPTDYCRDNPSACNNQGTCENSGNYFRCLCEGYMIGSYCETEDLVGAPCSPNPCKNEGTCMNIESTSFVCVCTPTFTGVICETNTDYCANNPSACNNRGTCKNSGTHYKCLCVESNMGADCESEDDGTAPCSSNPCQNGGVCMNLFTTSYKCDCINAYIGDNCETSTSDYCGTDPGLCTNIGICFNSGNYFKCCEFANGMNCITVGGVSALSTASCSPSPCLDGGVCIENGDTYACDCPATSSGNRCQFRKRSGPMDCPTNGCENSNEICVNSGQYNECLCINDQYCHLNEEPCAKQPCKNGGVCTYEGGHKYMCQCTQDYTGTNCDQMV